MRDDSTPQPEAVNDFVPESFRIQALERRIMALTNEKFMLENQLTTAEAKALYQQEEITSLKTQPRTNAKEAK